MDVTLVEYLVFTRMPGESYRRATQAFVVVLVLRISSANYLPCVLILYERPGPRSVSHFWSLLYHS